jgi:hypothetical protein
VQSIPGFDCDRDSCSKDFGNAAQHAEGVTFVIGRFEAADVLLGGFEFAGELLLGEAGFFAQRRELHGHVPHFPGAFEPLGKVRVF